MIISYIEINAFLKYKPAPVVNVAYMKEAGRNRHHKTNTVIGRTRASQRRMFDQ